MVNEAVILAAGLGSRLGDENDGKPKGLLQLGRQSIIEESIDCLLYTSPSPRDGLLSRMPSSA